LHLGVKASRTSRKLPLTTNNLVFQNSNIAIVQGLLRYLNYKRDLYIIYLTLRVKEDNPTRLYNDKSLVLIPKRQSKRENLVKSVQTLQIKKEQKGPA
jgi:hypothetical protein